MTGKQRQLRVKKAQSDDEAEAQPECLRDKLEETKLLQKIRKRTGGLDANMLAAPREKSREPSAEPAGSPDNTKELDAFVKSKTLNVSEEDPHMRQFVEQQLALRLGKRSTPEPVDAAEAKRLKAEQELYSVPEPFQAAMKNLTTETVLPGLITTIQEVPLALEHRLKNIEDTEVLKLQMLGAAPAGDGPDDAVPANKGVRRGMFAPVFGRQTTKKHDLDEAEQLALRRRFVSDPNMPRQNKR